MEARRLRKEGVSTKKGELSPQVSTSTRAIMPLEKQKLQRIRCHLTGGTTKGQKMNVTKAGRVRSRFAPTIPLTSITLPWPEHRRRRTIALTALGGPPRAPGDFQEALRESMEPAKPTGVIPNLAMAEGDWPVTKGHPCHDCAPSARAA
jgi:hypothetical protein